MKRALFLLLALTACGSAEKDASNEARGAPVKGIRVEEAVVHPSDASITLSFTGDVEGSHDAMLAAPLGGYVEAVEVKEGQEVSAGQVLVRVDASTYAARKDQAEAQAAQARAELERVTALGDLATPQQLLGVQTGAKVAEAALSLARTQLSRSLVTAPFRGVVSQIGPDPGEVVAPASPVCRLVQLDPVKVVVAVADKDVVHLQPGMPATLSVEARPGAWPGTITTVSAVADTKSRAFKAEIEFPNPDRVVLPGMIGRVLVQASVARGTVLLPQDAVVTRLADVGVFVDQDGKALWRPLELGEVIHDLVRVRSGLAEEEKVVVTGHRELVEGDALLVTRMGACCTDGRVTFED